MNLDCPLNSAIGFAAIWRETDEVRNRVLSAVDKAIDHFEDLIKHSITVGETRIVIWGRSDTSTCIQHLSDGSLLLLIGRPEGDFSWQGVENLTQEKPLNSSYELPWDGRIILLKIDHDGNYWSLWNDWLGSIPVFYTNTSRGRIASTLEPAVVTGGDFSTDDIHIPALISLLIHGNFLGDWTLFKNMRVVPPDCFAEWNDERFRYHQFFTVQVNDNRWHAGWDELVDEMYYLSRKAIEKSLLIHPSWILPLSGGLDSRLIASVAAQLDIKCYAYSWGPTGITDVIYAKQVAKKLHLPWKNIDPGCDYLCDYNQLWADLFGSAMHFHGMYQMPFMDSLRSEPAGPIVSGYIGDVLAGAGIQNRYELFISQDRHYQVSTDGYLHWPVNDIFQLMRIDSVEPLEQMSEEISRSLNVVEGHLFEKLRYLSLWGRQRHFTYFTTMLPEYWRGVSTPYLNREYARFCMSLPRCVLDERRLLMEMFKRYYPKVAVIPGTFTDEPIYLSLRYVFKRRLAQLLSNTPLKGSVELVSRKRLTSDIECVKNAGWDAFWPIQETRDQLNEWINTELLDDVFTQAAGGSMKAVRQLQSIQTLAYRLLEL